MNPQQRAGMTFTAPAIVALTLLFLGPSLAAFGLALTDFDIYALGDLRNLRIVGLGGFVDLARDPQFWSAVLTTLLLAGVGAPLTIAASLGAAMLLDSPHLRWRGLWRVLLFAPYVTTVVASAAVWRYLFNTRHGLINQGLGLIGAAPVDWLGDPSASLPAILIFVAWKTFGYNMVIFGAALATAPAELREAARLDGAGAWMRLRHVVLPAIGPVLLLSTLVSLAGFLQIFDEPYVMTQGGPARATITLTYFMFEQGFEWWSLGRASAVAVILFALTLSVTAIQVRLGRSAWA